MEWCYRVFRIKYAYLSQNYDIPVSVGRIQVESLKFQDGCSVIFKKLKLRVYRGERSITLSRDDESLKTSRNIDKRYIVAVS